MFAEFDVLNRVLLHWFHNWSELVWTGFGWVFGIWMFLGPDQSAVRAQKGPGLVLDQTLKHY